MGEARVFFSWIGLSPGRTEHLYVRDFPTGLTIHCDRAVKRAPVISGRRHPHSISLDGRRDQPIPGIGDFQVTCRDSLQSKGSPVWSDVSLTSGPTELRPILSRGYMTEEQTLLTIACIRDGFVVRPGTEHRRKGRMAVHCCHRNMTTLSRMARSSLVRMALLLYLVVPPCVAHPLQLSTITVEIEEI